MREEQLQKAVAEYLDICANQGMLIWHAVPNGGHMSPIMGQRRKLQGAKAGAPDLVIYWPGGPATQVELKTPKGKLSPSQKAWRDRCSELDVQYFVCRDLLEVAALVIARARV